MIQWLPHPAPSTAPAALKPHIKCISSAVGGQLAGSLCSIHYESLVCEAVEVLRLVYFFPLPVVRIQLGIRVLISFSWATLQLNGDFSVLQLQCFKYLYTVMPFCPAADLNDTFLAIIS